MAKFTLLISLFSPCILLSLAFSQTPLIEWRKNLGGTSADFGRFICQTSDGGYFVVGETMSSDLDAISNHGSGISDLFAVKLNALGQTEWKKCLGGTSGESGYSGGQTLDGGYIVFGSSSSKDGDVNTYPNHGGELFTSDFWLVKLDANGNQQWQKPFGGKFHEKGYDLAIMPDGGYLMVGTTNSNNDEVDGFHGTVTDENNQKNDIWVVRLGSASNLLWQRTLGGTDLDEGFSILATENGGAVIAGNTYSFDYDVSDHHGTAAVDNYDNSDCWVVKLDNQGQTIWAKTYGGSKWDGANCIKKTSDGGYILIGYTYSDDLDVSFHRGTLASSDVWVVKLDSSGTILWEKTYGGTDNEIGNSIFQTSDGGYIFAAKTASNNDQISNLKGLESAWIVKIDETGSIQWENTYGGTKVEIANSIIQTSDQWFAFAGMSTSTDGDIWNHLGDIGSDMWVVRLSNILSVDSQQSFHDEVFPNPSQGKFELRIEQPNSQVTIVDRIGQCLYSSQIKEYANQFNLSHLPKGIYTVMIKKANGGISAQKLILE
ncbi:MAG: T9SS type A sorting domain-containing protein [Bacteroidia bacterium]|nr:T9SS type A sorting domain-containing protein [Bacteroidia bacterium]